MTKIKIFMDGDIDNLMEDVNSFLKKFTNPNIWNW